MWANDETLAFMNFRVDLLRRRNIVGHVVRPVWASSWARQPAMGALAGRRKCFLAVGTDLFGSLACGMPGAYLDGAQERSVIRIDLVRHSLFAWLAYQKNDSKCELPVRKQVQREDLAASDPRCSAYRGAGRAMNTPRP
jgi:hypothetical protein